MSEKIKIAIAGSTERTVVCAEALRADQRFEVVWVLTPAPRALGRKKELTPNPVHTWANTHSFATVFLENKIDDSVKNDILNLQKPDFLLVVDFGYLVPTWLLELPAQASLNVHPSLLPRWRGSSPGQFVLLYGEKESAATLMVMNEGLDSGPVIAQLPFTVDPSWTQKEYYQHSFELMQSKIADLVADFMSGKISATPQPADSPTPVAKKLTRELGFIEWDLLDNLRIFGIFAKKPHSLNWLLAKARTVHPSIISLVEHASRAFSPWPGLWTVVKTSKGETRMKIIRCSNKKDRLVLDLVQFEGKEVTTWQQSKNSIIDLLE